jgi:hypothetical protein
MSVVIGRGGLTPEVKVGTLGLNLPPHRETAKNNHDEDQQLLHSAMLPACRADRSPSEILFNLLR